MKPLQKPCLSGTDFSPFLRQRFFRYYNRFFDCCQFESLREPMKSCNSKFTLFKKLPECDIREKTEPLILILSTGSSPSSSFDKTMPKVSFQEPFGPTPVGNLLRPSISNQKLPNRVSFSKGTTRNGLFCINHDQVHLSGTPFKSGPDMKRPPRMIRVPASCPFR